MSQGRFKNFIEDGITWEYKMMIAKQRWEIKEQTSLWFREANKIPWRACWSGLGPFLCIMTFAHVQLHTWPGHSKCLCNVWRASELIMSTCALCTESLSVTTAFCVHVVADDVTTLCYSLQSLNDVLLLEEDELQRQAKKKRAFLFLAYAARQLGSVVSRLGKIYRSQLDWDDHV